jgi:hypothetical protein
MCTDGLGKSSLNASEVEVISSKIRNLRKQNGILGETTAVPVWTWLEKLLADAIVVTDTLYDGRNISGNWLSNCFDRMKKPDFRH